MSRLAHRNNTILIDNSGSPDWASGYDVRAYRVGAQVASASSLQEVTVRRGHGFQVGDKLIVSHGGTIDEATFRTVDDVDGDTVTVNADLDVSGGDLLINLGADTGMGTPNYDGSPIQIYSVVDGLIPALADAKVTTNATGAYEYWTRDKRIWELVLDGNDDPERVITDVFDDDEVEGVFNINDFGAIPYSMSAAARNTACIQAAIDAAAAFKYGTWGGVVYIPPGVYYIDDSLTVNNRVTIRGGNRWVSVLAIHKMDGGNQIGLDDAIIKKGSWTDIVDYVTIESLRLQNYDQAPYVGTGIDLTDMNHSMVRDVRIQWFETGVRLNHVSWSNTVSHTMVVNSGTGVVLENGANSSFVSDCYFGFVGTGIAVRNGLDYPTTNVQISDCVVESYDDYGVDIDGSSNPAAIVGTTCIKGLRLEKGFGDPIAGVRIEGPEVRNTYIEGIYQSSLPVVVIDKGVATTMIGVDGDVYNGAGAYRVTTDSKIAGFRRYQAVATTTNATAKQLGPTIPISAGDVLFVKVRIWGLRTDGASAQDYRYYREIETRYYRTSAGNAAVWSGSAVQTTEGAATRVGFTTATAALDLTTSILTVLVTGEANKTVDWIGEIEVSHENRPAGS